MGIRTRKVAEILGRANHATGKIASSNVDVSLTNISDTGTEGTKIATGTSAQRGSTTGQVRYNTTTSKFEFRNSSDFFDIQVAPGITSLDVYDVATDAGGNQTFVITGTNFVAGDLVSFIANDATSFNASSTTVDSSTQITAVVARSNFANNKEPYTVKVTGGNGLSGFLNNAINVDNNPVWTTASGSLGTFADNGNGSISIQLEATDSDGDSIVYSKLSGDFPGGVTMSSSGLISGTTEDLGADTTYSFTIRATANTKTADRAFTITVLDNEPPVWSTASGLIATAYDSGRSGFSTTVVATDPDGDTITYSEVSGSLPSGLTLNTSTGEISGNADAVGTDTTSTFTLRATALGGSVDRSFSIEVKAPVIEAFTTSGSTTTWNVPSGLTTATILVVAGGGSGGSTNYGALGAGGYNRGGGGGAGGLIYIPSWDLTGSSSYDIYVGNGGLVAANQRQNGQNTTVTGTTKTLTALGGGAGGSGDNQNGLAGGSSGGGWYPGYGGIAGTQPSTTNDGVNTYAGTGFGNASGNSSGGSPYGAAGGGAGGAGGSYNTGQNGGAGKDYSSVFGSGYGESGYFASGGNATGYSSSNTTNVLGGGGHAYTNSTSTPSNAAANGQANTGGGGGSGGHGGSGVVLIKY